MRSSIRSIPAATLILISALTGQARAMEDSIGTECGTCQFPTAVRMPLCSGVYMGQGLVLTAAHCVGNIVQGTSRARFGEDDDAGEVASAVIESCVTHPDGGPDTNPFGEPSWDGVDLAFCILSDEEPIPAVPVVPPMAPTGCERDWLAEEVYASGTHTIVTAVGSGCADYYNGGTNCNDGVKRYVALQLIQQLQHAGSPTQLELERFGEDDSGIMSGDSGGPLFKVLPDGSWRLIGVAHGTALDRAYYEAVPPYLHWIEAESGRDITPCHEFSNGKWVEQTNCAGEMPLDTNEAGGSWGAACPSAMGGGEWGPIGGLCAGWPIEFDEGVEPSNTGLMLREHDFLVSAGVAVAKPAKQRKTVAAKLVGDLYSTAVFPFLANDLPGFLALERLDDGKTLRGVKQMKKRVPR